jgi:hypothetical protein
VTGYVPYQRDRSRDPNSSPQKSERDNAATVATTATNADLPPSECRKVAIVAKGSQPHPDDGGHFDERAAISERDGGLAREHAEALAAIQVMPAPDGISASQMAVVIDAAARFLDSRGSRT